MLLNLFKRTYQKKKKKFSFDLSNDRVNFMQEVGHFLAAFPKNVKLSIPFFIPNITLGSFGAITQVSIFNYFSM